jgi:hypothetical protein
VPSAVLRIRDVYSGPGGKFFFVAINFTKLKILSFPTGTEKFASVCKEGSNFTQKTVNKLSDMG